MEQSPIYDDLLLKWFLGEISKEEQAHLEEWMADDEVNYHYAQHLRRTWEMLALGQPGSVINVDQEWQRMASVMEEQRQPAAELQLYPGYLIEQKESKSKVVRLILGFAVAASVLLVIGVGMGLFGSMENKVPVTSGNTSGGTVALSKVFRTIENTAAADQQVMLSDSSWVVLSRGSSIRFPEPFPDDHRSITLTGRARFKVAKDNLRPFTVASGAIATTALGTEFTVTAYKDSRTIAVRLFEGKVVIEPIGGLNQKWPSGIYLKAGQELLFDTRSGNVRTAFFHNAAAVRKEASLPSDEVSIPKDMDGSWFIFNNQPLDQVLGMLSEMYKTEIVFSKNEVRRMYFVGRFDKSDSLEFILQQISLVNDLKLTKEKDRFILSK